ncbi:hypothetical protein AB9T89_00005, partial [Flavobacterium oncorhynchi]
MKKKFILIALLFVIQNSFAQNSYPSSGSVKFDRDLKIGNSLAPSGTLGEIIRFSLQPYGHTGGPWDFKVRDNNDTAFLDLDYGSYGTALTIASNRSVGIGTSNPLFKLDVNGVVNINSETDGGGLRFNSAANSQIDSRNWIVSSDGYEYGDLVFKSSSTFSGVPSDVKLTIKSNGNVGIGVKIPTNKLDVNGTIHSKEVKVDMNGWSDFVFKKEYNLPTLEQVEKHIIEKGHLQNIPSEKEVLKDGINLGEMNAKLLRKIEELTLYMIEMKKE